MLEKNVENAKCFELDKLKKQEAIFLKTADNCYFINCFSPIVTLGAPNRTKLVIKERNDNKACFEKTIDACNKSIKIGGNLVYTTAQRCVKTDKIEKIIFGFFKDVEQIFLDTIKKNV